MWCGGCEVGVAEATEDAQGRIVRRCAVEQEEWRLVMSWAAWSTVEEERGCLKRLGPVFVRHVCVHEEGARDVIEGSKRALGSSILRRSIWARHT